MRHRGVNQAIAGLVVSEERLVIAAAAEFVFLAATHEPIAVWIEREEHPDPAVAVDPEDEEISIVIGLDLDTDPPAGSEGAIVIEGDLDCRRPCDGESVKIQGIGWRRRDHEGRKKGQHGTSRLAT
jgi:hypothetical protein